MSELIKRGEGNSMQFKDQLSDKNIWVYCKHFSRYLRSTYNLSQQEYYSLIVFGDKDYFPKCKTSDCNNSVEFYRLSSGFREYCCHECMMKDKWSDPTSGMNSSERSKLISLNNSMKWKDPNSKYNSEEYRQFLRSPYHQFKCSRGILLYKVNKLNIKTGILYLVYDHSDIKIGVTFYDVDPRIYSFLGSSQSYGYYIVEGPSIDIINCEYNLKMKFSENLKYLNSDIRQGNWTEIFDISLLSELITELKSYGFKLLETS